MVIRTYLIDQAIMEEVKNGIDMVVCLAAGLDTRPYRLDLPKNLKWIEVDLPDITKYKTEVLKDETPRCELERIILDLSLKEEREVFL